MVYSKENEEDCRNALDNSLPCAFVDPDKDVRCVNTRIGHTRKGHQRKNGTFLSPGEYVEGDLNAANFVDRVRASVERLLRDIAGQNKDFAATVQFMTASHKRLLSLPPERNFWCRVNAWKQSQVHVSERSDRLIPSLLRWWRSPSSMMSVNHPCYACLSSRPEYRLPCGHYLCPSCTVDFGSTTQAMGGLQHLHFTKSVSSAGFERLTRSLSGLNCAGYVFFLLTEAAFEQS